MSRIITVKGTGTVSSKPDTVVLTMDLDSRHAEYGKCMKLATKELETLRRAIAGCQFADDALKTTDFRIEVSPFSSMTNERFRMAARGDNNVIHGLEFHKWAQTPGPLLTKYLRLAFRDAAEERLPAAVKQEELYHLNGTVLVFESDKGEAKLGLRYSISWGRAGEKNSVIRTILLTEKMTDGSPGAFADAMSRAAAKVSDMILSDIRAIEKKRGKDAGKP